MIDAEGVSLLFGGEGLNSSLNLDVFVSATLFLRANNPGAADETSSRVGSGGNTGITPWRRIALGVSSLSVGQDCDRLGFFISIDVMLKVCCAVIVLVRFTADPPELPGGLCGLLEYMDDATSGRRS